MPKLQVNYSLGRAANPEKRSLALRIMDENMHFKLFLKLEHKEEEVRRFSCGVNTEYGVFRGLVREAFGHLPGDDFVL